MVPDKFNMVDMGGIDLIMMQGEEVPGLYDRLVESIAQCRYQCLYNWFFDGVLIPPSYIEMEVNEDDEVAINEGITVSPDDVIHIYSLEPGPVDPEIIPLLAEENGVYNVPTGKDGFNPVTVDVPSYTPVISPLSITENGIYTAPSGTDGYSPVSVSVLSEQISIKVGSVIYGGNDTSTYNISLSGGYNSALILLIGRSNQQITGLQPYQELNIGSGDYQNQSAKIYSIDIETATTYQIINNGTRFCAYVIYTSKKIIPTIYALHMSLPNTYHLQNLLGNYFFAIYNSYTNESSDMTYSGDLLYISSDKALRFAYAIGTYPVNTSLDISINVSSISEASNSNWIIYFK